MASGALAAPSCAPAPPLMDPTRALATERATPTLEYAFAIQGSAVLIALHSARSVPFKEDSTSAPATARVSKASAIVVVATGEPPAAKSVLEGRPTLAVAMASANSTELARALSDGPRLIAASNVLVDPALRAATMGIAFLQQQPATASAI